MSQQIRKQTIYSGPYNKVVQISPNQRQFIFTPREKSPEFSAILEAYNKFSCYCSQALKKAEIPTHFIEMSSPISHVVRQTKIIPLVLEGWFCKRTFTECFEGTKKSDFDIRTFHGKDSSLSEASKKGIDWNCLTSAIEDMRQTGRVLYSFLAQQNFHLDSFRTTFGYDKQGEVLLCDHFSPFNMQIYDLENCCPVSPENPKRFLEFASSLELK